MAQKFLTNIDLNQNQLFNVVAQKLATDPQTPASGQYWFNTTSNVFKFYDGTDVQTFARIEDLTTALEDYQAKITASGILKGNGSGVVSAAVAGTDYGYIELTGSTDPTTSTVGAVGQHYLNTTSGVEFVCKAVTPGDTPSYTWVSITVDISGKQDTITVNGVVKSDGNGNLSAAVAGTDYDYPKLTGSSDPSTSTTGAVGQTYVNTSTGNEFTCVAIVPGEDPEPTTYTWKPAVNVTPSKALVSDANGAVSASAVTATELGYLSGVTSSIQDQLDNIPKLNYLDGVQISVSDSATQSDINTAAAAQLATTYANPSKYDAANVQITFTPSDKVKDALYMYNGSAWVFEFYTTTGIQRANGTTAGIIEEAASDSDLTLVDGVATVNQATKLRTARNITVQGQYGSTPSTDGITVTAASFDGSGNATIVVTAIKTEMLSGQVAVANGGTGKNSISDGALLIGNDQGGFDEITVDNTVTADSDNLITSGAVAAAIGGGNVAHKYSVANTALTPVSGTATWTVTHNLGSLDVEVQIYDVATGETVIADVTRTSTSAVTVSINSASNIAADTYKAVVIG